MYDQEIRRLQRSLPRKVREISSMLFMVIERFKEGGINPVGERFRQSGRMLPEGVIYHASWVEPAGECCFQIMEAPDQKLLDLWISCWHDLVDFEVIPVLTSTDFWTNRQLDKPSPEQIRI